MRERKPVIGVTCNFDYRDAVGMVSGMGITGQDWDFVSGDYVYILEKAGAIPVLIRSMEIWRRRNRSWNSWTEC